MYVCLVDSSLEVIAMLKAAKLLSNLVLRNIQTGCTNKKPKFRIISPSQTLNAKLLDQPDSSHSTLNAAVLGLHLNAIFGFALVLI